MKGISNTPKEISTKENKYWEKDKIIDVISATTDVICIVMKKRKEKIEQMLNETKKRLKFAPDGTLRISHNANHAQYYHRINVEDTRGKYIRKNQIELAKLLAQKEYDQKIYAELNQEKKEIEKFLKKYNSEKLNLIYQNLNPDRQKLVTPIILSDTDYIDAWKKVDYLGKGFREEDMEIYSDAGERVRSKSEVIIANKLFQMGIPYRYEYPIRLISGRIVYPDFYCLNARTRQEFLYEHFGMMDNPEYADKAIKKIAEYQQNGYWMGKNLIVSFETARKVLNIREVEEMLTQYLL